MHAVSIHIVYLAVYQVELALDGGEQRLDLKQKLIVFLFLLFILPPLFGTVATVSASPNIGLLRISAFLCPRQVVPGATFPVSLDVEYAIQDLPNEATIRAAVYDGNSNSTNPLWQSDSKSVSNGGDQVWNFTLNAPTTDGYFTLSAFAYFLNNGTWTYFNNTVNGPGVSERTIKIGGTANLDISVGAPNVPVTVDGTTKQSSATGDAVFPVAVSSSPSVSVPPLFALQNSTRIIFTEWSDGVAVPQRRVLMDGDVNITAQYRMQYLLTLTNSSPVEEWYDRGANVTLTAPTSALAPWPLSVFRVSETFQGWSGDIDSSSPQVNVTMNSPKTITADMVTNYEPLVVPAIFAAGIAAAIISFLFVQARSRNSEEDVVEAPVEEPASDLGPTCPTCGEVTEPEWVHCIKCGTKLRDDSSTSQVEK